MNKIETELREVNFGDQRLNKRFEKLAIGFSTNSGTSIPSACEDWAATKAAYRFFSNEKVNHEKIFSPHQDKVFKRIAKSNDKYTLILHDTTEISYSHHPSVKINPSGKRRLYNPPSNEGKNYIHYDYSILAHASLAITTESVPLGLTAFKMWTRNKFKETRKMRNKVNATRTPIEKKESYKWIENIISSTDFKNSTPSSLVHLCDRDSDMFEAFEVCNKLNTNFVIRVAHDRNTSEKGIKLFQTIDNPKQTGKFQLRVIDDKRESRVANIEVKYKKVKILPTMSKRKYQNPLVIYYIVAEEIYDNKNKPSNPILWKLVTNMPIISIKKGK